MTLLSEIIQLSYGNRKTNIPKTDISEVYGIIYRIYCIPENKSYVGQTFSHINCLQYLQRHGIISRAKIHYRSRLYGENKKRPLYQALNKYPPDQFEVFEEKRLYGDEIGEINQVEAEYIEKYNSLAPRGYNLEEVGKKYSRLLYSLSEHYGFTIVRHDYIDKTRARRCKDISFGVRFQLPRSVYSVDVIRTHLKTINITSIRLVKTIVKNNKELRLIVKEVGTNDNIRIVFKGDEAGCLEFAKEFTQNIEMSEAFQGESCYKYQTKLDKALLKQAEGEITRIVGNVYKNESSGNQTYVVIVYGRKDGKIEPLHRTSFGGKSEIERSREDALEFVRRLSEKIETEKIKMELS